VPGSIVFGYKRGCHVNFVNEERNYNPQLSVNLLTLTFDYATISAVNTFVFDKISLYIFACFPNTLQIWVSDFHDAAMYHSCFRSREFSLTTVKDETC
jgi:hypothetical protein